MAVPPGSTPPLHSNSARPQIRFDAIGEAWRVFQPNMSTWIVTELIFFVVVALCGFVGWLLFLATAVLFASIAERMPISILAIPITFFIPFTVILAAEYAMLGGMYRMAIRQLRGEMVKPGDIFDIKDVLGQLMIGSLLTALATSIGAVFCGLPGLILAGLLMFTMPLVVDKRMNGIDAMKLSFNTLKSEIVMAVLFFIVCVFIGQIGSVACGIGVLFTLPLFFLSIAITYREFFPDTSAGVPGPYVPPPTSPPPAAAEPVASAAPPAEAPPPPPVANTPAGAQADTSEDKPAPPAEPQA